MAARTHGPNEFVTISGFRVSVDADAAAVESAVDQIITGLRAPFGGHPEKLPHDAASAAWRQWYSRSLPLAVRRIGELILAERKIRGYGRDFVRQHVLAPLCALNGDVPVAAPQSFAAGTLEKEVSELAFAIGRALASVDADEPRSMREQKIAEAQREFGDLVEVKR